MLPAGDIHDKPLYVFQLIPPASWSAEENRVWVKWDAPRNRVVLSASPETYSLVSLGPRGLKGPRGFQVATLPTDFDKKQRYLKMGSIYICEDDGCYGPVESSEVSLVSHTTKNGNKFRLEPVPDGEM